MRMNEIDVPTGFTNDCPNCKNWYVKSQHQNTTDIHYPKNMRLHHQDCKIGGKMFIQERFMNTNGGGI